MEHPAFWESIVNSFWKSWGPFNQIQVSSWNNLDCFLDNCRIYAKVCDRRFVSMEASNKRPATEDAGHLET
jgi:hypothetical protein